MSLEKISLEKILLNDTITITDWRESAACLDSDPNLFFPVGSTGPAVEQIAMATSICTSCGVVEDCLKFALETNQESGVWGGYSEEDRRRLRKRWLARRRRRFLAG